MRVRYLAMVVVLVAALAACSSGAKTPTAAGPPDNSGTATNGGGGANGGGNGFEGSLATSGKYAASWTANTDSGNVDPFNSSSSVGLTSDQQTFGFIEVQPDGSFEFGSGAPALSSNAKYTGTGARVTMDPNGRYVCAFTVDADATGTTDSAVLHVQGTMTVHWHPEGLGDNSCP
jgi:hypothetical protein